MRSISSLTKEFIVANYAVGDKFTAADIEEGFRKEGIGDGRDLHAVASFLSALLKQGYLQAEAFKDSNSRRARYRYTMVRALDSVQTNDSPSQGGARGRNTKQFTLRGTEGRDYLADRLLDIAAKVLKLKPSLADYSTEELLAELVKRQKKVGKVK